MADLCAARKPRLLYLSRAEEGEAALLRHHPQGGRRISAIPRRLSGPALGKAPRQSCSPRPCRRRSASTDAAHLDRKSVVSGKSVSVRVDLGGRRIIKKKTLNTNTKSKTITSY